MPGTGFSQVPHQERRSPDLGGRRRRLPGWVLALLVLLVPLLVMAGCTLSRNNDRGTSAENRADFVTASGRGLVLDGGPTRLKAVNFSNLYHRNMNGAELLTSQHHSKEDFARAKDIGFNSIRFAFDGDWYVDSPQVFWQWLDQNVAWAREHEMRLILDLHTPIGGFWLDPTSDAVSFELWTDPRLQQQNADLWRNIAARYKDEPTIAAYDLLNEPVTTDATGEQWKLLAQQLVDAVRSEDQNHLLVVGGIYGVNGGYGAAGVDQTAHAPQDAGAVGAAVHQVADEAQDPAAASEVRMGEQLLEGLELAVHVADDGQGPLRQGTDDAAERLARHQVPRRSTTVLIVLNRIDRSNSIDWCLM